MIPEVDGLDVCRELRKASDVPIIMITARGEEIDRVVGLELGADDYVTKPFSVRELMARIKAVLRRAHSEDHENAQSTLLHGPGGLGLDVDARAVLVGGVALNLTRLEFDLLHHLLSNVGRVLTRERLLEQTWGYDFAAIPALWTAPSSACGPSCGLPALKPTGSNLCAGLDTVSTGKPCVPRSNCACP
jgi:DNA-binding response OmpR family regulator